MKPEFKIGCHASISNGILKGIQYVHETLKGNAIQIFLGNPKIASMKNKSKPSESLTKEVSEYVKKNKLFLVVHGCYVLNFAKFPVNSSQIQYAIENVIYDLKLSDKINSLGVVLHMGYQLKLPEEEAYQNMANCLMKVIDKADSKALVILETAAGQGTQIAVSIEDLARLYHMFPTKYQKKIGFCIDTCHVFSSGYEIHTVKGIKDYMSKFNKLIGKDKLVLFHINDSKHPLKSRKDKHEGIGYGYVYESDKGGDMKALEYLTKYAKKYKIPMVLETHGGASSSQPEKNSGNFADEIKLLNSFV